MTDRPQPIRRIAIIGGGTAGWIAAALIASQYPEIAVELVESDAIGTIGVGESTIPPFLQLLARLGISESEFIQQCQASYKLGVEFRDWKAIGHRYFHPFGAFGMPGVGDFYQLWLHASGAGYARALTDFAPASVMAHAGRFTLPFTQKTSPIGGATYALHVDATRVARFLRGYAEARGVVRTEGMVQEVATDARGFVGHVALSDGRRVAADFFLDCTGFRSVLSKAIPGGDAFDDWGEWLMCDRAVAVQTANVGDPAPYTLATAEPAGWRWRIPLQHRTGNGHVFSSRHLSEDEGVAQLLASVEGEVLTDPLPVRFRTGVRERVWNGNVCAIGLSAGFVEPLESTAIHLIYRGMDFLFRFLPSRACEPALRNEYNRRIRADYEEIRDFIVLHYCLTERRDTPFWRACADAEPPRSLTERIALFRANGSLRDGVDDLFRAVSWQAVMEGMGVRPAGPHPSLDRVPTAQLARDLDQAAQQLAAQVERLPSHGEFLARHCAAPTP